VIISEDFASNFGDIRTGCCITATDRRYTLSFAAWEFLTKTNMTVVSKPPYFSRFSRLKIKLLCRHFDTTDVIKAETYTVLKTLIKHNSQHEFKMAEALGTVHTRWQQQHQKL
jgi:hypothetical protein